MGQTFKTMVRTRKTLVGSVTVLAALAARRWPA